MKFFAAFVFAVACLILGSDAVPTIGAGLGGGPAGVVEGAVPAVAGALKAGLDVAANLGVKAAGVVQLGVNAGLGAGVGVAGDATKGVGVPGVGC